MEYPPNHEPIWIDWRRARNVGLRFIAYTDEEGRPFLGVAHLGPAGEMQDEPVYSKDPIEATHDTGVFEMPTGEAQLFRFAAQVSGYGLTVKARPLPSHPRVAEARAVAWLADTPAASF